MMIHPYLYHHGIKGQKWGVRNGPPYPLDKKTDSKDDNVKKLLSAYVGCDPASILSCIAIAKIFLSSLMASHAAKKDRDNQSNELDDLKNKSSVKSLDDLPKLTQPMTAEESMKVTNPGFPDGDTTQNCTFCTSAMAMREKGYDVVANESPHPWHVNLFDKVWGSTQFVMMPSTVHDSASMLKELASHGSGTYGNLTVASIFGGGHSVFWKNENGRVRIYDGQSGQEYVRGRDDATFFDLINYQNSAYNRLDNCDPTEYALAVTRPRGEGGTR